MNIPGVGRITVKKLVDAGYSPNILLITPYHIISKDTWIGGERVMTIVEYVRRMRDKLNGFMNAKEYIWILGKVLREFPLDVKVWINCWMEVWRQIL